MDAHTPIPPSTEQLATWAQQYRSFGQFECPHDPLYAALCAAIVESPTLLAWMQAVPATQRRPNLLLAALHERVLALGLEGGGALAAYYPSVNGKRLPDADLPAALHAFALQHEATIIHSLRTRSTQTNEVGRCAVLWPALQHISEVTGRRDLALLDFGSSAGLNLGVDSYHYRYQRVLASDGANFSLGAAAGAQRAEVLCEWRGEAPAPQATPWRIGHRQGLDLSPVDVQDESAVRWLRACLWPHDRERARRLDLAVSQARQAGHRVVQASDCTAAIEPWLKSLPTGVQPVLFNSFVLTYFSREALKAHEAEVLRLVREYGLVWLSAEGPEIRPGGLRLPNSPEAAQGTSALWVMVTLAGDEVAHRALAWSHPHGRWVQWLAGA